MAESHSPIQINSTGILLSGAPPEVLRELIQGDPLFNLVLNTTSLAVLFVDTNLLLQFTAGKAFEGLQKLRPEEWLGQKIDRIFTPDPEFLNAVQRSIDGEHVHIVVKVAPFTFKFHFEPVTDANQKVLGVLGIAVNATEGSIFHQALQESEQRFQVIFNQAPVGILILSPQGLVIDANSMAENILNCSGETFIQKSFFGFIQPAERARVEKLYGNLRKDPQDELAIDCKMETAEGAAFWGRITATFVQNNSEDTAIAVCMLEDISQHKQLDLDSDEVHHGLIFDREQERLSMAQELHDGPLQDLISASFMLQAIVAPDQPQLDQARDAVQAVINTIRQLCSDLRPPTLAPLGLEKAIRSHAETFQRQHPELRVFLNLSRDDQQLSEKVRIAVYRAYQETMNNIARHANARNVWTWLNLANNEVVLEIRDDGQGFNLPARWVHLVRAGHFGLAGIKERMDAIHAHFEIESGPGRGTLVRVRAPTRLAQTQGEPSE